MDTKTTIPISEARKKIFKIAEKVQKPATHYTLTEKGRPKAVIMSAEEFESWQETLEVMRNFPGLEKDIKKAEKEYKRGDCLTLEKILAKEGFVLAGKAKKRHVSHRPIKKRSKRS
jgi:prevent-host-death family protein